MVTVGRIERLQPPRTSTVLPSRFGPRPLRRRVERDPLEYEEYSRGCYELTQKRLTNAENWRPTENRTNGDIRISMRFPAEFITRSREALTQRESGSFFTP